jgi:hypothetical protein
MGCGGAHTVDGPAAPQLASEPWPEADALFRSDADWLGGDGALSVPLDDERTLWLFGDSFMRDRSLRRASQGGRAGSVMVRNSIALQTGASLASAQLRFYARHDAKGRPTAFFPDSNSSGQFWLWPGHGVVARGRLVLFMHRMKADDTAGGLGFVPVGHSALSITNIGGPPPLWQIDPIELPAIPSAGLIGVSVLREGAHFYAFGVRDPGDRALTLVRWDEQRFVRGDLSSPEVWAGPDEGFARGASAAGLLGPVSTELSVTRDPRGGFVLVHSHGFGVAPIHVRFAPALTGPWSAPTTVDLAPYVEQRGLGNTLVYAAKAHPEQEGAEWVVTFAVNDLDPTHIWQDLTIYFPRVLKLRRAPRRRPIGTAPRKRSAFVELKRYA